jgi:hypothetical protein
LLTTTTALAKSISAVGKSVGFFLSGEIYQSCGFYWFWQIISCLMMASSTLLFVWQKKLQNKENTMQAILV